MRSYSRILPPVTAALVTLVLTWLVGAIPTGPDVSGARFGIFMMFLLPVPFVVSLAWGTALMTVPSRGLVFLVGGAWLLASLALQPGELTWQMAGNALAGLGAGWALASRWRLDWALGIVAVALLPTLIWSTLQLPLDAQMQDFTDQALEAQRELLVGTADERQVELSLAKEARKLEAVSGVLLRIFPGLLALGVLGQGGLILALIYWVTRRMRVAPAFRSLPPFTRWQLPFYLVWILVAGIGLVLTRQADLVTAGLNIVLVALLLISIQGVAIQGFVTNSLMSGPVQIVFWLVMGFLFIPLLIISGILLGLADYWLDIRRLNVPVSPEQDEDDGIHDDDPDA